MQVIVTLLIFIVLNATTLVRAGSTGEGDCCTACSRNSDSCWEKCRDQPLKTSTGFPECISECKEEEANCTGSCNRCPISADCCSRCEVDFLSCGVVCDKGGFSVEETAGCLSGCKGLLLHGCIDSCGGCEDRFGDLCEILRSRSTGFPDVDLCSGCSPGYEEDHDHGSKSSL